MDCSKCGRPLRPRDEKCPNCGEKNRGGTANPNATIAKSFPRPGGMRGKGK